MRSRLETTHRKCLDTPNSELRTHHSELMNKGIPMPFTLKSFVKLNNGVSMPLLGLGVYLMRPGKETYLAVRAALEIGYRLLATASLYGNEEDVGRAVPDHAVPP